MMDKFWMVVWILGVVWTLGLTVTWILEIGRVNVDPIFRWARPLWVGVYVALLVFTFEAVWL